MQADMPISEDQVIQGASKGPRAIDIMRSRAASDRRMIESTQLGGLRFYFARLTYADLEFIDTMKPKTSFERSLMMLIHKAQDENGMPVFQMGDLYYLQNEIPFQPLSEVVEFMWASSQPLTEESIKKAEAEIEANPSSGSDSPSESN
jgi:hypothetical protein